jgi:transcriptional regulator with PAS, ATPase and Fis domain
MDIRKDFNPLETKNAETSLFPALRKSKEDVSTLAEYFLYKSLMNKKAERMI